MKSTELAAILTPFAALINKHALSDVYKTLEIGPKLIRACAPWGIMEADVDLGCTSTFYVDATTFIGVIKSLPSQEIALAVSNNTLTWKCGNKSSGNIGIRPPITIPDAADWSIFDKPLYNPSKSDTGISGIGLGALACGSMGMGQAGLYGVAFDFTPEGIVISSSDDTTIAVAKVSNQTRNRWPKRFALLPEATVLLDMIIKQPGKNNKIEFQEKVIYVRGGGFRLMLKSAPLLKQDLVMLANNYTTREDHVELPREGINAFIRRASALAETKDHTHVTLRGTKGDDGTGLTLSFAEGVASAEEIRLVGLQRDIASIKLDAGRLAKALAHTDEIAFDHIDRGILLLYGKNFDYLICGIHE